MPKKQLVWFAGISLVATLAACGGVSAHLETNSQPSASPPPEPPPPAKPAPLSIAQTPLATKRGLVELLADRIVIKEKIQFEQGQATIKAESNALLDEIAKVFAENPQIKKVEIQGHASGEGDAKANLKLSDDRARSVQAALVSRQVKAEALAAKGYGSEKKLAEEKTEADRETNRRVEFLILDPKPASKNPNNALLKK